MTNNQQRTGYDFALSRSDLRRTQSQMADEIGLSRRAYIDIENGASPVRKVHWLALERAILRNCAKNKSTAGLNQELIDDILDAAEVIQAAFDDDQKSKHADG